MKEGQKTQLPHLQNFSIYSEHEKTDSAEY